MSLIREHGLSARERADALLARHPVADTIPILGAIISDTKWGRFKTIAFGTAIGFVAHIILVIAAIPKVIQEGHALAPFLIGLLVLAGASGFIVSSSAWLALREVRSDT